MRTIAPSIRSATSRARSAEASTPAFASIRQQSLDRRLVLPRHGASGMAGQVGELHRDPREPGAGIARRRRPFRKVVEERVEDLLRSTRQSFRPIANLREREFVPALQHRRKQLVLAPEVIVKRALGDARRARDVIDPDAIETLAVEQRIAALKESGAYEREPVGPP